MVDKTKITDEIRFILRDIIAEKQIYSDEQIQRIAERNLNKIIAKFSLNQQEYTLDTAKTGYLVTKHEIARFIFAKREDTGASVNFGDGEDLEFNDLQIIKFRGDFEAKIRIRVCELTDDFTRLPSLFERLLILMSVSDCLMHEAHSDNVAKISQFYSNLISNEERECYSITNHLRAASVLKRN